MENIFIRRSIRKYEDKKVEDKKIEKLLRAAMQAPSAMNQQCWEFIVIKDKDTLKQLSNISPYSKLIADAPLAIILLGNSERMKSSYHWQQDLGAATQNILLESVELGLGSVWLGVAPLESRMNYVKEMFGLGDNLKPFSIITVGYPAEGQSNKFIDRFDQSRIHYEKY